MELRKTQRTPAKKAVVAADKRLQREWKTVSAMIHIYCRDKHGGGACTECTDLLGYVRLRLDRCRFGSEKPTCARCPVHCYQRDRREQIKAVMRYAGPRMTWEHPWLSLCHLLDGWFRRADLEKARAADTKNPVSGPTPQNRPQTVSAENGSCSLQAAA